MADNACGAVDVLSGAVCTLDEVHLPPHRDESDRGVILVFPDEDASGSAENDELDGQQAHWLWDPDAEDVWAPPF